MSKRKKNFIFTLIAVAFVLLFLNIVWEFLPREDVVVQPKITKPEIEKRLFHVFQTFSLDENWVKKTNVRPNGKDSLTFVFNVKIPRDVLITDVLKSLNIEFPEEDIEIISKERKIGELTSSFIYVDGILHLQVNFRKERKLKRMETKLSLIVNDFDLMEEDLKFELLSLPFRFAVFLRPTEANLSWKQRLENANKDYFILLDDELDDEKYILENELSRIRLKSSVISICTDFGKNKMVFINTSSDLYKSIVYNFIKDEFAKRGYKIYSSRIYKSLSANSIKEVASKFKFYEESLKGKPKNIFTINGSELLQLKDKVEEYLMRGNKILPIIK